MPCGELDILVVPPLVLGVAASYNYDLKLVKADIQDVPFIETLKNFQENITTLSHQLQKNVTIVLRTPNILHK